MIVTTTDLKQDYEVKGIVRFYMNSNIMNAQLGKQKSVLFPLIEAIDYIIENILTKQAEEKGADAIVGLRIEPYSAAGMASTSEYYIFYGTAVKLK